MKATVHSIATHHTISKTAYRMHILGMCVRVMRSFIFNVIIFLAGASIGMGLTVMQVQKIWENNTSIRSFLSLKGLLKTHSIHDKKIEQCLMQIRNDACATEPSDDF